MASFIDAFELWLSQFSASEMPGEFMWEPRRRIFGSITGKALQRRVLPLWPSGPVGSVGRWADRSVRVEALNQENDVFRMMS